MDESDKHSQKLSEQRTSTLRGIVIDISDVGQNAFDPIRLNWQPDSNETYESEWK
jgi:hypothetical protein